MLLGERPQESRHRRRSAPAAHAGCQAVRVLNRGDDEAPRQRMVRHVAPLPTTDRDVRQPPRFEPFRLPLVRAAVADESAFCGEPPRPKRRPRRDAPRSGADCGAVGAESAGEEIRPEGAIRHNSPPTPNPHGSSLGEFHSTDHHRVPAPSSREHQPPHHRQSATRMPRFAVAARSRDRRVPRSQAIGR